MFIYNVTVNVDQSIENDWIQWMKNNHIPKVMASGHFKSHKFLKLLSETPDAEGNTYAIQYFADSLDGIDEYLRNHAPQLQKDHIDRYQSKCLAFRTVLEEV